MAETKEMSNMKAVKVFFDMSLPEMKDEFQPLSDADKQWFGDECRKALMELGI